MRFARYEHHGVVRVGVVEGTQVHDLNAGDSLDDLIEWGLSGALDKGRVALGELGTPLSEVRLLSPLAPASLRDFVAFEEHVEGIRRSMGSAAGVPEAWYEAPTFYFANHHRVLGPGDEIAFPADSRAADFELEVAVVVGRRGSSISVEAASQHVFGYMILNDWSARDLQAREMQVGLGPAKGKDFAVSLGPWIVTPDELAPFRDEDGFLDLECVALVNDVEVGRDRLAHMGWTFEAMLAYASRDSVVVPGDVLGSGTVGNGGCLAELWGRRGEQDPPPLEPGDVVSLSVEGLGVLTNVVGRAAPVPPVPEARPRRRDGVTA